MSRPSVTVPLPRLDAGLVVSLWALASLAAVCVAVGMLTDYRWAILSAGVLGFAAATYVSHQMAKAEPVEETPDNVVPIGEKAA
jgi:hypothetical protein